MQDTQSRILPICVPWMWYLQAVVVNTRSSVMTYDLVIHGPQLSYQGLNLLTYGNLSPKPLLLLPHNT
jgi:hypothetical protein